MKIDPFYLIVDGADWAEKLVPLGVKTLQLRIKEKDLALVRQEIIKTKEICARYECLFIVNDYWQIALEEKCSFVHLGQEDLEQADLKAIRKAHIKLGISTHNAEELAYALEAQPDYVALGPIYPTLLKQMPWVPQSLEGIKQWKNMLEKDALSQHVLGQSQLKQNTLEQNALSQHVLNKHALGKKPIPLIAIGGFTVERARAALEAGADSVAVISDILLSSQPQIKTQQWIEATKKWR